MPGDLKERIAAIELAAKKGAGDLKPLVVSRRKGVSRPKGRPSAAQIREECRKIRTLLLAGVPEHTIRQEMELSKAMYRKRMGAMRKMAYKDSLAWTRYFHTNIESLERLSMIVERYCDDHLVPKDAEALKKLMDGDEDYEKTMIRAKPELVMRAMALKTELLERMQRMAVEMGHARPAEPRVNEDENFVDLMLNSQDGSALEGGNVFKVDGSRREIEDAHIEPSE